MASSIDTIMVCPKALHGWEHQFYQQSGPPPRTWVCLWCGLGTVGYMPKELRVYVISEELEPW